MKYASLLRVITPPVGALALIVLLLFLDSAAALLQPWLAGEVTGAVVAGGAGEIGHLLLAWLALLALKSLLGFGSQALIGETGERMAARLRRRVYEHLQVLPMAYFHHRKQGETLALLTRDAEVISQFITLTLVQLLPQMATFAGALLMMAWLDPTIAALALVLMPVYFLGVKLAGRRIRPIASAWIRSWSEMYALAQENLGMMAAIKAFTREPLESRRFGGRNRQLRSLSRRQVRAQAALASSIAFLAGAGLLLLVWVGATHVRAGSLDAAGLVSLLLYAALLTRPLAGLASVYGQVQQTRGAAERLLECFSERPEPDSGRGQPLGTVEGAIRFEHVDYAYPGRAPTLRDVNLDIRPGETVAVIGPNGAGKSTLAWLLMRYADPDRGRILVDGIDIAGVSLASLRTHIGLVPQHALLLNASVRDNIAYGDDEALESAVRSAALAAGADGFIAELPDGYETLIGDRGVRLSGGQRQRLALARTLLQDPPIIVLDEATSMFDPQAEQDFLSECAELLAGRTVIMITHRPVSLAIADRVIRMDHGAVVGN